MLSVIFCIAISASTQNHITQHNHILKQTAHTFCMKNRIESMFWYEIACNLKFCVCVCVYKRNIAEYVVKFLLHHVVFGLLLSPPHFCLGLIERGKENVEFWLPIENVTSLSMWCDLKRNIFRQKVTQLFLLKNNIKIMFES